MNKKALELIPCCNRYGKEWGRPIDKDWAHKRGVIHPTVHVLVFNLEKELIVQLRKKTKQTNPLHWDVSTTGHIDWGESPTDAAIRETREELGLQISQKLLTPIGGWYSAKYFPKNSCMDREFNWVYLYTQLIDQQSLMHQPEEIEYLAAAPLDLLSSQKTWNHYPIVPHPRAYWDAVQQQLSLLRL